jgi:uncharacterized protein YndB with AHSA1/START domain
MTDTKDREMRSVTSFKVSPEVMWQAWTRPEYIVHWWGPDGFTNTIDIMDVREGGEWKFTMHGPDGTNFPNRSVFKEIVPLKKIVFEHFNPHFFTTVLFESKGNETQVDWTLLFDTVEMRDIIVKTHKADEGQRQNLEKLDRYLSSLQTPQS